MFNGYRGDALSLLIATVLELAFFDYFVCCDDEYDYSYDIDSGVLSVSKNEVFDFLTSDFGKLAFQEYGEFINIEHLKEKAKSKRDRRVKKQKENIERGIKPRIIIDIDGGRYTINRIAKMTKYSPTRIYDRIRLGERGKSLLEPKGKIVDNDGNHYTAAELSKRYNIPQASIRYHYEHCKGNIINYLEQTKKKKGIKK